MRHGYTGTRAQADRRSRQLPLRVAVTTHFSFPGGNRRSASRSSTAPRDLRRPRMIVFDPPADLLHRRATCLLRGAAAVLVATDDADAVPDRTVSALEVASSNEPLRVAPAEVFESWIVIASARFSSAAGRDDSNRARSRDRVHQPAPRARCQPVPRVPHERSPRSRGAGPQGRRPNQPFWHRGRLVACS